MKKYIYIYIYIIYIYMFVTNQAFPHLQVRHVNVHFSPKTKHTLRAREINKDTRIYTFVCPYQC